MHMVEVHIFTQLVYGVPTIREHVRTHSPLGAFLFLQMHAETHKVIEDPYMHYFSLSISLFCGDFLYTFLLEGCMNCKSAQ
jgi:hypothetical protein